MIRNLARRLRSSAFAWYLIGFLILIVSLFLSVTAYLYVYIGREVREQSRNSRINQVTSIAVQHDAVINSMLNTAEQIGLSPYMEPFCYREEPWRAWDLKVQLQPYVLSNPSVSQMYLYFSADEHLYSAQNSMTLDMFGSMLHFERLSNDSLREMLDRRDDMTLLPVQRVESSLLPGGSGRMVVCAVPLGMSVRSGRGAMLYLIEEKTYQGLFSTAAGESRNIYLMHGADMIVSLCDFALEPEDLTAALSGCGTGVGTVSFTSGHESLEAVCLSEKNRDFRYISVVRTRDVDALVRTSMVRMSVILLLLVVLAVLLALWLTRRSVRPIREITGMLPHTPDAAEAGELDTIRTAIAEMTEHNHMLAARVEAALPMQRHDFVINFIKGRYPTRKDAVAAAAEAGMDIDLPRYAVILSGAQDPKDRLLPLSRGAVKGTFTWAGIELIAMRVNLYLVFADTPDTLSDTASWIHQSASDEESPAATAMSACHADFSEASAAYLEAAAAYDDRFIGGISRVLTYTGMSSGMTDSVKSARHLTEAIRQAILTRDPERLDDRITDLLQFLKHSGMSPYDFRMIYNDVIVTLTRADPSVRDGTSHEFYDIFSLSSCQSIDDLDHLLRRLCAGLIGDMRREGDAGGEDGEIDVITQVLAYMQEHFCDPEISIAAIAESFDMSTARLSTTFRERMQMTPLEHLSMLRAEHAKVLLKTTDMTIRDIGMAVGYYDTGSFTRRFKQITGMTPMQYRKSGPGEG